MGTVLAPSLREVPARSSFYPWLFPLGTRLKVTHLQNGRSVICGVNDRGLAKRLKRLVDLTQSSFREIADVKRGLIKVRVVPLGKVIKRPA